MPPVTKVYIAGPAVFQPDFGDSYYSKVRELLKPHGMIALCPTDKKATGALPIRNGNILLIEEADAILADLSPFRSNEPDCGTAFEVGYGAARGKVLITFTSDCRTMREKYGAAKHSDGTSVEDFDLPFNLMLTDGAPIADSLEAAVENLVSAANKVADPQV